MPSAFFDPVIWSSNWVPLHCLPGLAGDVVRDRDVPPTREPAATAAPTAAISSAPHQSPEVARASAALSSISSMR